VDHQLVEAETHIKYDNLLSAADGGHVPSDFVVSTYGDNFYFHCFSPVFVYRLLIAAGKNPGFCFQRPLTTRPILTCACLKERKTVLKVDSSTNRTCEVFFFLTPGHRIGSGMNAPLYALLAVRNLR
jgi:hypothetical protein